MNQSPTGDDRKLTSTACPERSEGLRQHVRETRTCCLISAGYRKNASFPYAVEPALEMSCKAASRRASAQRSEASWKMLFCMLLKATVIRLASSGISFPAP